MLQSSPYVADTNVALAVRFVTQTPKICGAHFEKPQNQKGRWAFETKKFQQGKNEMTCMNDYQTKYLAKFGRRLQLAADIAQITSKYIMQMEPAPELKDADLDSS